MRPLGFGNAVPPARNLSLLCGETVIRGQLFVPHTAGTLALIHLVLSQVRRCHATALLLPRRCERVIGGAVAAVQGAIPTAENVTTFVSLPTHVFTNWRWDSCLPPLFTHTRAHTRQRWGLMTVLFLLRAVLAS
jgi:hypothetical protein